MAGDKHRNNGRAMVGLSPVTHRRLKVYHDQLVMWALEHPQLCPPWLLDETVPLERAIRYLLLQHDMHAQRSRSCKQRR